MMSGIKGKDTKPELVVRKSLFAKGFRYRLHDTRLPGKPDLVFPKYKAVIFIHGCFWHRHDCHLFKWPSTRPEFWRAKITRNTEVDKANYQSLSEMGWRILTIWECALKGKTRKPIDAVAKAAAHWLEYGKGDKVIQGDNYETCTTKPELSG